MWDPLLHPGGEGGWAWQIPTRAPESPFFVTMSHLSLYCTGSAWWGGGTGMGISDAWTTEPTFVNTGELRQGQGGGGHAHPAVGALATLPTTWPVRPRPWALVWEGHRCGWRPDKGLPLGAQRQVCDPSPCLQPSGQRGRVPWPGPARPCSHSQQLSPNDARRGPWSPRPG